MGTLRRWGLAAGALVTLSALGSARAQRIDAGAPTNDTGPSALSTDAALTADVPTAADATPDEAALRCPLPSVLVDRAGHCCRPGQRWLRARCQGPVLTCPPGEAPRADRAGCEPRPCEAPLVRLGQRLCCLAGQTEREGRCVGRVEPCPAGSVAAGGGCVPSASLGQAPHGPLPPSVLWVPGGIYRAGARVLSVGAFAMDRTEVTAQAYQGCVTAGVCEPAPDPYGLLRAPGAPVVNVRWMDAVTYCGWVGGRLPTEAEWELAGRSVDGRRYPWGERLADCSLAQLNGCGDGPRAVGSLPAGRSPFGVLDLAGNVAEWVSDRLGPLEPGFVRDPTGPDQGLPRVVRGGSFGSVPAALELGARGGLDPRERRYNVGFRCVRGG